MSDEDHVLAPRQLPECDPDCREHALDPPSTTLQRRRCSKCRNRQMNRRLDEKVRRCWTYRLLKRARCNRIGRGSVHEPTDIDHDYLKELYEQQGGCCYWTGVPLGLAYAYKPWSISLDRLDHRFGYRRGNVALVALAANFGRNRASAEEMIAFIRKVREVQP